MSDQQEHKHENMFQWFEHIVATLITLWIPKAIDAIVNLAKGAKDLGVSEKDVKGYMTNLFGVSEEDERRWNDATRLVDDNDLKRIYEMLSIVPRWQQDRFRYMVLQETPDLTAGVIKKYADMDDDTWVGAITAMNLDLDTKWQRFRNWVVTNWANVVWPQLVALGFWRGTGLAVLIWFMFKFSPADLWNGIKTVVKTHLKNMGTVWKETSRTVKWVAKSGWNAADWTVRLLILVLFGLPILLLVLIFFWFPQFWNPWLIPAVLLLWFVMLAVWFGAKHRPVLKWTGVSVLALTLFAITPLGGVLLEWGHARSDLSREKQKASTIETRHKTVDQKLENEVRGHAYYGEVVEEDVFEPTAKPGEAYSLPVGTKVQYKFNPNRELTRAAGGERVSTVFLPDFYGIPNRDKMPPARQEIFKNRFKDHYLEGAFLTRKLRQIPIDDLRVKLAPPVPPDRRVSAPKPKPPVGHFELKPREAMVIPPDKSEIVKGDQILVDTHAPEGALTIEVGKQKTRAKHGKTVVKVEDPGNIVLENTSTNRIRVTFYLYKDGEALPPDLDGPDNPLVRFVVKNQMRNPIEVYWKDPSGTEHIYAQVSPGGMYVGKSWTHNTWVVRDSTDGALIDRIERPQAPFDKTYNN